MSHQAVQHTPPALISIVRETTVADVQLDDDGAPSQVNGYRVLKQLGVGTTSKVYRCQDESGQDYALKILNKSFLKRKREYKKIDGKMVFSNAFQKVKKEVAIMKKLSHPNLVKLFEIIDSPADDKMVLVLELISGGQVMTWEEKGFHYCCLRTSTGVLDQYDVRRCMRDVIDALEYLHKNCICHRDIKPENILLAAEDTYKLADFGVAHMIDDAADKKTLRNTEGTYHFLAPECTTGDEYDPYKVDVWALGVTMFTLLFGTLPFGKKAASLTDVMDSIRVDPLVFDADAIDANCASVLRAMLAKDPSERITLEHLKQHAWFHSGVVPSVLPGRMEPSRVEVTREEIDAAFTPVNNFILMVRIKMKMASRLAHARISIDLAKGQFPLPPGDGSEKNERAVRLSSPLATKTHDTLVSTSNATPTTSTTPSTSPPSSPRQVLLKWQSSFPLVATPSAARPLEVSSAGANSGTSPTIVALTGSSRRRSSLAVELVVEEPPTVSETSESTDRPMESSDSRLFDTAAVDAASYGMKERTFTSRTSTNLRIITDTVLPILEGGSTSSSPSGSPASSSSRRRLTPRPTRDSIPTSCGELDTATVAMSDSTKAVTASPRACTTEEPCVGLQRRKRSSSYPASLTGDATAESTGNDHYTDIYLPHLTNPTGRQRQPSLSRAQDCGVSSYDRVNSWVGATESHGYEYEGEAGALTDRADSGGDESPLRTSRTRAFRENPLNILVPSANDSMCAENMEAAKATAEKSAANSAGLLRKKSNNAVAPLELLRDDPGFHDGINVAKRQSPITQCERLRSDDESLSGTGTPKLHLSTKYLVEVVSGESPTPLDIGDDCLLSLPAILPRKSVLESHESIRLVVLDRSASVRALLATKKTGLETADASLQRNSSLAQNPLEKGVESSASTKIPPAQSSTSGTCAMQ